MKINADDLLNSIIASLDRVQFISSEDIPNIDLYMDQVTTFMDSRLRNTVRDEAEDKVLTKTMINNYAKNNLLPPPVKKKYSREHVLLLIFIYSFFILGAKYPHLHISVQSYYFFLTYTRKNTESSILLHFYRFFIFSCKYAKKVVPLHK